MLKEKLDLEDKLAERDAQILKLKKEIRDLQVKLKEEVEKSKKFGESQMKELVNLQKIVGGVKSDLS